jgi:hypothetical protein
MLPNVIPLAVLVRQGFVNKVVERTSANFLVNLRKKCDLHTEVGFFVFVLQLKPTGFVRNQLLLYMLHQIHFGQV